MFANKKKKCVSMIKADIFLEKAKSSYLYYASNTDQRVQKVLLCDMNRLFNIELVFEARTRFGSVEDGSSGAHTFIWRVVGQVQVIVSSWSSCLFLSSIASSALSFP